MYRNFLKRLIDFFIVLSALLIIWPILLIIIIFLHFANKAKHNLKMIDPSQFPGLKLVGVSYLREAINAIKLK